MPPRQSPKRRSADKSRGQQGSAVPAVPAVPAVRELSGGGASTGSSSSLTTSDAESERMPLLKPSPPAGKPRTDTAGASAAMSVMVTALLALAALAALLATGTHTTLVQWITAKVVPLDAAGGVLPPHVTSSSAVGRDTAAASAASAVTGSPMPDAAPAETAGKKSTPRRIVAVGDLHGDLSQALFTLTMAGLIDGNRDWAGGDAIFVQTGDVVDRGPDTIELYQMMMRLAEQAPLAGGQVLQLLGNHEVMNMQEDLRYVVPMDYETFGGTEARREAWSKDGWLGKYLRTLDITAWVNGTVFFHGGAHPAWARLGIDGMNVEAHKGLIGKTAQDIWNVRLFGGDGPLWYRGYAIDDEASACRLLDMALEEMNATRMVVGHTPQLNGQILRRCKGKFYVIDVGISRVYGGHSAALEIVGDRVTGLYPGGKRVRLQ